MARDNADCRRGKLDLDGAPGSDDEWEILVQVKNLVNGDCRTFEVGVGQTVSDLKKTIRLAAGPPEGEQRLQLGSRVLQDVEQVGEILTADALQNAGGCLTLSADERSDSQQHTCSCGDACHQTVAGFVDYFGTCQRCGKNGGPAARCQLCAQTFPSLYVLDVHLKFVHSLQLKQLQRPDRQGMPARKRQEIPAEEWQTLSRDVARYAKHCMPWLTQGPCPAK
mmetsp:Transcript_39829/g.92190  ORF Transcript_39829/g.92190 Transcript_39829/m.92190 type:complete len:223 (-) Transcript_39829:7-675(-)